jgi:hypothetical protein
MKHTLISIIALMAIPGFAQDLAEPLSVIIATDWKDGFVADTLISSIRQTHDNVNIEFPGQTPPARQLLELKTLPLDKIDDSFFFTIERENKWLAGVYMNVCPATSCI